MTITVAVESTADDLTKIIEEIASTRTTEEVVELMISVLKHYGR